MVNGYPLLLADGEVVGSVRRNATSEGAEVRLKSGEVWNLETWVAVCCDWSVGEARKFIAKRREQEEELYRKTLEYPEEKTPWGVARVKHGARCLAGPIYSGLSVVYGAGRGEAVSAGLTMVEAAGVRVFEIPGGRFEVAEWEGSEGWHMVQDAMMMGESALVYFPHLPLGNYYSHSWFMGFYEHVLKPIREAGASVLLFVPERRFDSSDPPRREPSEWHLKGDPLALSQFTLVALGPRRELSWLIGRAKFPATCSPGALFPPEGVAEGGEDHTKEGAVKASSEIRVGRVKQVAAMAVEKKPRAPRKKAVKGGASGLPAAPEEAPPQTPLEEAAGATQAEIAGPEGVDLDPSGGPLLFVEQDPTGEEEDLGHITPVPHGAQFEEKPERVDEVIVTGRTTDELLARVWEILKRAQVVAYDADTLWVLSRMGEWVSAAEDPKQLRFRLYKEISWTEWGNGTRFGPRQSHRALLELTDLMLVLPVPELERRPTAREGRVVKVTEMEPLTGPIVALDCETSGPGTDGALNPRLNFIELLQINDGVKSQLLTTRGCTPEEITACIQRIFDHAKVIVGHNLLFDLTTIYAKTGLQPKVVFDTFTAAVILRVSEEKTPGGAVMRGLNLGEVGRKYLGVEISKELQRSDWGGEWTIEQLNYAQKDVEHLHALMEKQVALLNKLDEGLPPNACGLRNKVARLEMALILVMVEVVVKGIPVNRPEIERAIREAQDQEIQTSEAFQRAYPQVLNLNSREQVLAAFAQDGVALPDLTAETVALYSWHPGVKMFHEYKVAVQVYRNLKKYREDTVYPNWRLIGGAPGRMSTSEPSVQNIPKSIKPKFYSPSLTLVKADYPAIESRLAAVYTGETGLIEAFNAGEDIHILTASKVMNKPKEEVQKKERQLAKALNYGLLYGVGAGTFAASANADYGLELTVEQAAEFREKFFDAYPALREWHHGTARALRQGRGMVGRTLFGRVIRQNEEDYTDALNSPIQGSGADLLKLAAVQVWNDLKKFDGRARILNLVHDEIVLAVYDPTIKAQVAVLLRDAMEGAAKKLMPEVRTPVEVDIVDAQGTLFDSVPPG